MHTATLLPMATLLQKNLKAMAEHASRLGMPPDMTNASTKIKTGKGFSDMSAKEWRDYTNCYSLVLLEALGDVPEDHLEIWREFVRGSRLLSKRVIRDRDLAAAQKHFIDFGKLVRDHDDYGDRFCTTNMHMHIHLPQFCRDYGPLYAFWCFAFERYNGILKSFSTNRRDVALVCMRTFTGSSRIMSEIASTSVAGGFTADERLVLERMVRAELLAEYDEWSLPDDGVDADGAAVVVDISGWNTDTRVVCSYHDMSMAAMNDRTIGWVTGCEDFPGRLLHVADPNTPIGVDMSVISQRDLHNLSVLVSLFYPSAHNTVRLARSYQTVASCMVVCGEMFGSQLRCLKSSFVTVRFVDNASLSRDLQSAAAPHTVHALAQIDRNAHGMSAHQPETSYPGQVMFYCEVRVYVRRRVHRIQGEVKEMEEKEPAGEARGGHGESGFGSGDIERAYTHRFARVRWFKEIVVSAEDACDDTMKEWRPSFKAVRDEHQYAFVPLHRIEGRFVQSWNTGRTRFRVCKLPRSFAC